MSVNKNETVTGTRDDAGYVSLALIKTVYLQGLLVGTVISLAGVITGAAMMILLTYVSRLK